MGRTALSFLLQSPFCRWVRPEHPKPPLGFWLRCSDWLVCYFLFVGLALPPCFELPVAPPFWLPGAAATPAAASHVGCQVSNGPDEKCWQAGFENYPCHWQLHFQFCLEMVKRNSDVCDFLILTLVALYLNCPYLGATWEVVRCFWGRLCSGFW